MMFSVAHRFTPDELGALDLDVADARVIWAIGAKASSVWSSSYAASSACGPPAIYPRGGDESGTWLAKRSDRESWIELTFPERATILGILVCETCGPGAVCEIRDVDRDVVLYEGPPVRIADSRSARLFYVPLPPVPGPLRLRLTQQQTGSHYHEIDAVALLTAPLETILASPPSAPSRPHYRYAPADVAQIDVKGDWRISWATSARASSEYSSRYGADTALGRPTVFPESGDKAGTWLSASDDRAAWIELEFGDVPNALGLLVFETCSAGSVVRATDEHGEVFFQARHEELEDDEARLLYVPLEPGSVPAKVRLWVSPAKTSWREIDAVALISVPFEELFEPAPPAPPPPPPGAPAGGFTILGGTLVGASPASPFVHAILCTAERGRAANHGGALRLILDDGSDVTLETGRTAVYGGVSARRFGSWEEVSAALQPFAAAFAGIEPTGEVVLQGQFLQGEEHVWVVGIPRAFCQDGVPESLVAVAISRLPLEQTTFADDGVNGFERRAQPHQVPPVRPHPLRRAARNSAMVAAVCALVIVADLVGGGPTLLGAYALLVGLYAAILAIEFGGRIAFVPTFIRVPSAPVVDHRPACTPPKFLLWGMFGALFLSALPLFAAADFEWSGAFLYLVSVASVAPVALLRLVLYGRRYGFVFLQGLGVVHTLSGRPETGVRRRFSGRLAQGQEFTRTEGAFQRAKHLGTDRYQDEHGRMVEHDRYSSWLERRVSATGPSQVRLRIGDREIVRAQAPRTTVVDFRCTAPQRGGYFSFESLHGEGDPATLIGAVRAGVGDALEVEATHLVLGDFAELRRRVYVQLFVFLALLSIVVIGSLAFVV